MNPAPSVGAWPSEPVSVVASRRINCATPMQLNWRERASL